MTCRLKPWFVLVVTLSLVPAHAAHATCSTRSPTPQAAPGPHDFSALPSTDTLWNDGDPGQPLFLRARVLDTCGKPVADAAVQILHANEHGEHEPGRFRAELRTDERGAFKVITVYPGYAGGLPRHIHFNISHKAHQPLVTRLYFKNDPAMGSGDDPLAIVLEEVPRGDGKGWIAGYEFVLQPR